MCRAYAGFALHLDQLLACTYHCHSHTLAPPFPHGHLHPTQQICNSYSVLTGSSPCRTHPCWPFHPSGFNTSRARRRAPFFCAWIESWSVPRAQRSSDSHSWSSWWGGDWADGAMSVSDGSRRVTGGANLAVRMGGEMFPLLDGERLGDILVLGLGDGLEGMRLMRFKSGKASRFSACQDPFFSVLRLGCSHRS